MLFLRHYANKLDPQKSYITSIRTIRMSLRELQKSNMKTMKISSWKLAEGWKDIKRVFYHWSLLYIIKILDSGLINWYYNDFLPCHFKIKKLMS